MTAVQLWTGNASACSCVPPPPPPPGTQPTLRVPSLDRQDSAVFVGVVEEVYPKSLADVKARWRKMFHQDLSQDKPPSVERVRTFMLHFWSGIFSSEEKQKINEAKSLDDLESATGNFWMAPRRVRIKITESFAGPNAGSIFVLYTGLGGGDCGVDFEAGERWLVTAFHDGADRWGANICTITMPESKASAVLAALRALK